MTKPKGKKTRRSYDLPDEVTAILDRLSTHGFIKERVVAAGVRLFAGAPADLQEAALAGDEKRILEWFSSAYEVWAVSLVEKMKRDGKDASGWKCVHLGAAGGKP